MKTLGKLYTKSRQNLDKIQINLDYAQKRSISYNFFRRNLETIWTNLDIQNASKFR